MGKGRRTREERLRDAGMSTDMQDSIDAMEALDTRLDPMCQVRKAPRTASGMPPVSLIEEYKADARQQGCTCVDPQVLVHRSASGLGGAISLGHKEHCPLWRVLAEETP